MASMSAAQLQQIPKRIRFLVFGCMREWQSLFDDENNHYYNIPDLVIHICLAFYHNSIGFDKNKCGSGLKISGTYQNTTTCMNSRTKHSTFDNTVYHTQWIPSMSNGYITYKLRINKLHNQYTMFIGFASTDHIIDYKFYSNTTDINYALQACGTGWVNYGRRSNKPHLTEGNIVSFTLDLTNSRITLFDQNLHICFDNIEKHKETKYKFAVAFHDSYENDSISIVDIESNLSGIEP
eukprot:132866_1